MKRKVFILGLLAIFSAGVVFLSCQKDESLNPEEVILKKGKITSTYSFGWNEDVCAGEDLFLTLIGSGNRQIQMLVGDEWVQIAHTPNGDEPLVGIVEDVAAGIYYFRHTTNQGFSDPIEVVVENCGCEEAFYYDKNEDGTYTFTYIPEEVMTGAKVEFTFAQAVTVELDGFDSNPNGNVMQTVVDLPACEPISWTVRFTELRCNGSGQSTINAWTDFKVNDNSKKGTQDNIELPCE